MLGAPSFRAVCERVGGPQLSTMSSPQTANNPQTIENKQLKRASPWQRITAKTAILNTEQKSPLKSGLFLLPEEDPPAKSLKTLETS